MLKDARAGLITDIAAYSWSRLTRRPKELELLIDLFEQHGVQFHIVNMGNIDLSKPDGRAVARTVAAWDAAEAERTGDRVAFAQAGLLANGHDIGGPRPFGYEKDRKTIRESEAKVLRAGYEMILNDPKASVWAVAKLFTESGIKRDRGQDGAWRTQTVRHILLRERNVGRLVVNGVTYATNPDLAIISEETFERVKAILENPARVPRRGPKPRQWAAIGTVRCGVCGNHMSQTGQRKKDGKRHLKCSPQGRSPQPAGVRHPTIEVEKLDLELSTIVSMKLTQLSLLKKTFDTPANSITPLRLKVAELVRQRDAVQMTATFPGANLSMVAKQLQELGKQIDETQAELDAAMSSDVATAAIEAASAHLKGMETFVDRQELDMSKWHEYWAGIDIEIKRTLIRSLVPGLVLMPLGQGLYGFRLKWPEQTFAIETEELANVS
jgi:hypothetical protein